MSDAFLDRVAERLAGAARAGMNEVLRELARDFGADAALLGPLEPLVLQAGVHVKETFLGVLHSRVMPAARAALTPSPRLHPTTSPEQRQASLTTFPPLAHNMAGSDCSSTEFGEHHAQHVGAAHHAPHIPAHVPRTHVSPLLGVMPSPSALLSAYASNTSAGGDDDFAGPGHAFVNAAFLGASGAVFQDDGGHSGRDVGAPLAAVVAVSVSGLQQDGPSSSSFTSHVESQGPSSRAPSPVIMSPAAVAAAAASAAAPFGSSSQQPALLPSHQPPPPPPLTQSPHQRLLAASMTHLPSPPVINDKLHASFDGVFHTMRSPLDSPIPGMMSGMAHRPASFNGVHANTNHGTLSAPGSFRRQPPPSVNSLQQQLLELQREHGSRSSDTGSSHQSHHPMAPPPPPPAGAFSDSLIASLMALDQQSHGNNNGAYMHQDNSGGGAAAGALPSNFDVSQLVSLLAASGANTDAMGDFLSADSTPDSGIVSRTDSYGQMQRPAYVPAAASPLAPLTPAAAVAAAGRALNLQQAQEHAALAQQLQSLHLQQQQLQQQQAQQQQQQQQHMHPAQLLQLHLQGAQRRELEALRDQQQRNASQQRLAAAAAAAFGNGAYGGSGGGVGDQFSGGGYGGSVGDQFNGGGSFVNGDQYGYAPGGVVAQPQEMPKRLQVLPEAVQNKIVDIVTKLPVLQLKDFDDKVVYKLSLLLEQFGLGECINMLGHLMERIKKKDKSMMRNGPGYLDVAVSTHIDEMKALEKGAGTFNMPLDEYARQVLPVQLFEALAEAVDANRWLRWEDLDQGIVNVLKKMPRDSAFEKLHELTFHSFKNVDNTKGCIMSILNGRGEKGRRTMLGGALM